MSRQQPLDGPARGRKLAVVALPDLLLCVVEPQGGLEGVNLPQCQLVLNTGAEEVLARVRQPRLPQLPQGRPELDRSIVFALLPHHLREAGCAVQGPVQELALNSG